MKVCNSNEIFYIVENVNYKTVKDILVRQFSFSKRLILKLKQENRIYVNNIPRFVNYQIKLKDCITIDLDFIEECDNIIATKMKLDIIYEDEFLLILNKPPKIETHPTMANNIYTLSNGVKYYFEQSGLKRKIRPVNRLDKDTSGIIVFAKNQYIQEELVKQMKNNIFKKEYLAIVDGKFEEKEYTENIDLTDAALNGKVLKEHFIEAKIARKPGSILERCIDDVNGAYAKTYYDVLKYMESVNSSLVKLELETGRTHQIRVHMKYLGHPLIGDFLYGEKSNLIDRQALHSYSIQFIHPITKQIINLNSKVPNDFWKCLKGMK